MRCAICVVKTYIHAIKATQSILTQDGGVFASRDKNILQHKTLRMIWRKSKVELINLVSKLEHEEADGKTAVENQQKSREALALWESNKMLLTIVPGVVCRDDKENQQPTDEDHEVAKLMGKLLEMTLKKEMTTEDLIAVQTPGEHKFDRIPQAALPTNPALSTMVSLKKTLLKPAINSHISTSKKTPPIYKRVHYADTVTISPERLNISNVSAFTDSSDKVKTQAHNIHTSAEHCRARPTFHRGVFGYEPGVWASEAGYKKANTSFFRISPSAMEMKVDTDLDKAESEMELSRGLKVVFLVWLATWWVKNVLQRVRVSEWKALCTRK